MNVLGSRRLRVIPNEAASFTPSVTWLGTGKVSVNKRRSTRDLEAVESAGRLWVTPFSCMKVGGSTARLPEGRVKVRSMNESI